MAMPLVSSIGHLCLYARLATLVKEIYEREDIFYVSFDLFMCFQLFHEHVNHSLYFTESLAFIPI